MSEAPSGAPSGAGGAERIARLRQALMDSLALKALPRAGWARVGVSAAESVAAHSWGVAWLALVLCPAALSLERVLGIAVIHDLAEARVGDLTPYCGVSAGEKRRREDAAMRGLLSGLPGEAALYALWRQYEDGATPEGRFVKALDKLDMALQAAWYADRDGVETREFVQSALSVLEDPTLRALALA